MLLEDLSGRVGFEAVTRLLWDGFFDDLPADLARRASARRGARCSARSARWTTRLLARSPIEALRALMARLPDGDDLATALRLTGRARRVHRRHPARAGRRGGDAAGPHPVPRRRHPAHDRAARRPATAEAKALDAYLVTVCDHGLNASTFAARVTASTHAGLTLGGDLRPQRAERPAARRRARAGDLHARRDRPRRRSRSLAQRRARPRRPADGLRPPGLPRPRPTRRRAEERRSPS